MSQQTLTINLAPENEKLHIDFHAVQVMYATKRVLHTLLTRLRKLLLGLPDNPKRPSEYLLASSLLKLYHWYSNFKIKF